MWEWLKPLSNKIFYLGIISPHTGVTHLPRKKASICSRSDFPGIQFRAIDVDAAFARRGAALALLSGKSNLAATTECMPPQRPGR